MITRFLAIAALALMALGLPEQGESADELLLDAYKGKVVVLDFWASWCVPCRRSFPWMNEMLSRYGDDGLVILAVNLDKERAAADAFLEEVPARFEILFDPDGTLAREYGVEAMPSSFVFDREGALLTQHLGFKVRKQDEYETVLVSALGGTP